MNMMCVCPAGGQMTSRKRTSSVSGDECGALVFGDQPVFATHVEWDVFGVEHHRDQVRITGQFPHGVGADRDAAVQSGLPHSFGEHSVVEDDVEVRLDPTMHRS